MTAALLTLADSRLPAGGHAHSGGVEQAIAAGIVRDPATLADFLLRRLQTAGVVAAALAAAACGADAAGLPRLDEEADARTPSPAVRSASRRQGRGLVRVGRRAWPSPLWNALPGRPHHPIALGVASAAAGLSPRDAASTAAYLSISGPATAAQRLLALDPIMVAALTARLAPEIDAVTDAVTDAAVRGNGQFGELAGATDPLLDLLAEVHVARKDRFFAS